MSFSKEIKEELLNKKIDSDCCGLAFLCGIITACGKFSDSIPDKLEIVTDILDLNTKINNIIEVLYGQKTEVECIKEYNITNINYYKITFPKDITERILLDTGCLYTGQTGLKKNSTFDEHLIKQECCLKSFVAGLFVGCGTSSITISKSNRNLTGYHLEFASKNIEMLRSLACTLAQFDVFAKVAPRRNEFVLYVKDANEVSNVLALMGAFNSVLELQNEMATRELRNKINRQNNCMNANINKTIESNYVQLQAIEKIINLVGLDYLDEDLQVVALLRLANTEESLSELLSLSKLPLTKSGLNHRFQKIIKLSNNLKEE